MRRRKGFSLVELLIVVLILAALATIAIPRIVGGSTVAKINACKTNVDLINSQIEMYHANTDDWPVALTDVTADANYFPDGEPVCPFETAYTLGSNHRVAEHTDGDHGL